MLSWRQSGWIHPHLSHLRCHIQPNTEGCTVLTHKAFNDDSAGLICWGGFSGHLQAATQKEGWRKRERERWRDREREGESSQTAEENRKTRAASLDYWIFPQTQKQTQVPLIWWRSTSLQRDTWGQHSRQVSVHEWGCTHPHTCQPFTFPSFCFCVQVYINVFWHKEKTSTGLHPLLGYCHNNRVII